MDTPVTGLFLIDRQEITAEYLAMIKREKEHRIIRVNGDPKMGKSHLLRYFRHISLEMGFDVIITVIRKDIDRGTILNRIVDELDKIEFKEYHDTFDKHISTTVKVENALSLFSKINIDVSKESNQPDLQHVMLRSLMRDIRKYNKPVILLFDAFDQGSQEIQNWLNFELLRLMNRYHNILSVVAGINLPSACDEWKDICFDYKLLPVSLEDYMEYCKNQRILLDERIVRTFHMAVKGSPGLFVDLMDNLPRNQEIA